MEHYHSVHAINLLGQKDAEAMLSVAYSEHLSDLKNTLDRIPASAKASSGTLSLTPYDFHAAVKVSGHDAVRYDLANRLSEVADSTERYGWTAIDAGSGQIVERQEGVFRVNCLDWYVSQISLRSTPLTALQPRSYKLRARRHLLHNPFALSRFHRVSSPVKPDAMGGSSRALG